MDHDKTYWSIGFLCDMRLSLLRQKKLKIKSGECLIHVLICYNCLDLFFYGGQFSMPPVRISAVGQK